MSWPLAVPTQGARFLSRCQHESLPPCLEMLSELEFAYFAKGPQGCPYPLGSLISPPASVSSILGLSEGISNVIYLLSRPSSKLEDWFRPPSLSYQQKPTVVTPNSQTKSQPTVLFKEKGARGCHVPGGWLCQGDYCQLWTWIYHSS